MVDSNYVHIGRYILLIFKVTQDALMIETISNLSFSDSYVRVKLKRKKCKKIDTFLRQFFFQRYTDNIIS